MLEETWKGRKGIAIEHYEKFLELWKDADPGDSGAGGCEVEAGWIEESVINLRGNKPTYLYSLAIQLINF
jgi:hypothetical protein